MDVRGVSRGISLVELVIVVVIFGLLAALAIPRLSSGAPSDAPETLRYDLAVLRSAIELYYLDHGVYPGQRGPAADGSGAGSEAAFTLQLTRYSDAQGRIADRSDADFCFGPYLRDGMRPCSVPPRLGNNGVHVIAGSAVPGFTPAAEAGWVYNCETGDVAVNSDARDPRGVHYDSY